METEIETKPEKYGSKKLRRGKDCSVLERKNKKLLLI